MKVIRSPIVYDAEQFHSNGNIPKNVTKSSMVRDGKIEEWYSAWSHNTSRKISDGEWIVTDSEGFSLIYSDEEFKRIFERVE